MHLIRFFEKKTTINTMKNAGLIDKKGKLLDNSRTRDIRKAEIELKMLAHPHIMRHEDFNIKKKLREQLHHLANRNLIL